MIRVLLVAVGTVGVLFAGMFVLALCTPGVEAMAYRRRRARQQRRFETWKARENRRRERQR